jgi:hypothetical protein
MDKISEEDKTFIRKYWASYYRLNEELESFEVKRLKLMNRVETFEKKYVGIDRVRFSSYCFRLAEAYNEFLTKDKCILEDRSQVEQNLENNETIFLNKLHELGLHVEEREYDEELYNFVNGLEEEEYKKF